MIYENEAVQDYEIEYFNKVCEWAKERNLIEGSNPEKQFFKTLSELLELINAVDKDQEVDGYGDAWVTLVVGMHQFGFDYKETASLTEKPLIQNLHTLKVVCALGEAISSCKIGMQAKKESYCDAINMLKVFSEASGIAFKDCLEKAWDEIKDRKGKMINGMFVKESDLPDNEKV